GMAPLALVLFGISALLWLVLGYGIPFAAVLGSSIRPVVKGVNGTWFVWVVAAQSVAVVASSLALELPKSFPSPGLVVALTLVAVIMWAVGLALYIACALFVGMRVLLHRFGPEDLDAPYWVTMGALAISIVAGSRLLELESTPILDATRLLVSSSSALLWAFATWLIPSFVLAGAWRHFIHRVPMTYSAGLWSMVFPLGMYSVASIYLGRSDRVPPIEWIGQHWFWVGLVVWAIVFSAMVASFVRPARDRCPPSPSTAPRRCRRAPLQRCVPARAGRDGAGGAGRPGPAGQPAIQASKRWPSGLGGMIVITSTTMPPML